MRAHFKDIDSYIRTFPAEKQEILQRIRRVVKSAAPEAQEAISYQMPTFKLNGKNLIHFAAFQSHIGLYPPAPKELREETAPYAGPKGNLTFPLDQPIPYDLIERIVKTRLLDL